MEAPVLQITVVEGPRNGEILVCEPGSTIQIGRVIKGNNMALRDPGISQKHLRFQFVQEDSGWFVSDLDTSNGTILNGLRIQTLVLVPISDGDVFQIGEKTTLGVKIVTPKVLEEKEEGNNVRRSRVARRGGSSRVNTTASSSRVSEEEAGLKEAQSGVSALVRGRRNNARPISARVSNEEEKKEETLDPDLVDSVVEMGQKGRGRGRGKIGTRNSARVSNEEEKKEETLDPDLVDSVVEMGQKGRGRGKGKIGTSNLARVLEEEKESRDLDMFANEEEKKEETLDPDLVDSVVEMGQKGRGRGRGKIGTKNSARVLEEEKESRDLDMFSYTETKKSDQCREAKLRRNPRRCNSSRVLKELDGNFRVDSGLQVKEVGMKREGRRRGNGKASTVSEEERENDENLVLEIDSKSSDPHPVAAPELRKGIKTKTNADSSMVIEDKEGEDVGAKKGGERTSEEAMVNFENKTLDEWFDSLELSLPKEISEESEKIIGIMKEKARKFDEFLEAGIDEA